MEFTMQMLKSVFWGLFLIAFVCTNGYGENKDASASYYSRIGAVPKESGFHMEGWFVWGGSCIEVDGEYHLFSSRWPEGTKFPQGYRAHSEIVHAKAKTLLGPYEFQGIVLGKRDAKYWDSKMVHNPSIYKTGDVYVLYYNASQEGSKIRQVGYATATNINGPWKRNDNPIDFDSDANNPAAYFERDGSVKLMWRDAELRVYVATAPSYKGPYTIQNDNVYPKAALEDFYLFFEGGKYHMLCEDNVGGISGHERWGVHLVSDDGVHDWKVFDPAVFYDRTVRWTDGTSMLCERRERPQLLIDERGAVTHLFTSTLFEGKTWTQVVPIAPR